MSADLAYISSLVESHRDDSSDTSSSDSSDSSDEDTPVDKDASSIVSAPTGDDDAGMAPTQATEEAGAESGDGAVADLATSIAASMDVVAADVQEEEQGVRSRPAEEAEVKQAVPAGGSSDASAGAAAGSGASAQAEDVWNDPDSEDEDLLLQPRAVGGGRAGAELVDDDGEAGVAAAAVHIRTKHELSHQDIVEAAAVEAAPLPLLGLEEVLEPLGQICAVVEDMVVVRADLHKQILVVRDTVAIGAPCLRVSTDCQQ
jgi:hypothetical protein